VKDSAICVQVRFLSYLRFDLSRDLSESFQKSILAIRENEDAQDARSIRLEALGGFGIGGFDLSVEKKGDPEDGKRKFVEPEHAGPPGARWRRLRR